MEVFFSPLFFYLDDRNWLMYNFHGLLIFRSLCKDIILVGGEEEEEGRG